MEETTISFSLSDASPILEFWREFDLDGRRLALDKTCVEMREQKTASIAGRKGLNDITKLFRSKSKEDQIDMVTELLKAYQEEIDQLSRRSKFSETAFYGLYKAVYEAPDPALTIEALINMVTTTSTHQFEVERLKGELEQYEAEFQQLKNQDITIRRLEDQLMDYREKIEDKVAEEVNKRTVEIEGLAENRIAEIRETQRAAEKRLAAAVESMKQAQFATERAQNQLYEVSSQAEVRLSALSAENSMLAEGADRMQARIAEVESELDSAKTLVASLQAANLTRGTGMSVTSISGNGNVPSPTSSGSTGTSSRDASATSSTGNGAGVIGEESHTLQIVISDLKQEIRRKEESFRSDKQRLEVSLREAAANLVKEREILSRIRQELAERPTKEDMRGVRKQLRMLQRVAFNVEDEDDEDASRLDPEHTLDEGAQLELIMATRMKALESDLAQCRRELREAKQQETSAQETITTLRKSLETSTSLISRLEADFESQMGGRVGSSSTDGGRGKGGPGTSRTSKDSLTGGSMDLSELLGVDMEEDLTRMTRLHSSSSVSASAVAKKQAQFLNVIDVSGAATASSAGAGAGTGVEAGNQMVTILQAQRDRYKDRLGQVETTLLDLQQQVKSAHEAKLQLEADNMALYGKIRYLQTYGTQRSAPVKHSSMRMSKSTSGLTYADEEIMSSMRSGIPGLGVRGHQGAAGGGYEDEDLESRYHSLYEQRMNPFAEFSQHERQRKLQELSVADRIVLNTTLAFVSSQAGRSFVVIYLATMHLLVFIILYYNAHHVHYGCDPSLDHAHAAAAHAAAAAMMAGAGGGAVMHHMGGH